MMMKWWVAGVVGTALLSWPVATFAHGLGAGHRPAGVPTLSYHGADSASVLSTLSGTLTRGGPTGVSLSVQGVSYTVRFGPPWYTASSVLGRDLGTTRTLVGQVHAHTIQAHSVNGRPLRDHGKPPWAGVHGKHGG